MEANITTKQMNIVRTFDQRARVALASASRFVVDNLQRRRLADTPVPYFIYD